MTRPGGPPYPLQQQQPVYVTRPTSTWAVTSLIFGIFGALGGWCMLGIPCLIAVLTGHAGLRETESGAEGGHGMAVTGTLLGYLFGIPWAILGTSLILTGSFEGVSRLPSWTGWTIGVLVIVGGLAGIAWYGWRRR